MSAISKEHLAVPWYDGHVDAIFHDTLQRCILLWTGLCNLYADDLQVKSTVRISQCLFVRLAASKYSFATCCEMCGGDVRKRSPPETGASSSLDASTNAL